MIQIGEQLKYYRQQKQLTQKEVAEKLHVTPQTISKWELDKSYPDLDQLSRLSQLYRKKVDVLLGQGKPSFFDYLMGADNFRKSYGLPAKRGVEKDGENQ